MTQHDRRAAFILKSYSNFYKFLADSRYGDVRLACDGLTYECHRIVLAAASPFFESIFNKLSDKTKPLEVKIDFNTLERILEFIYTGDTDLRAINVIKLYKASQSYALTELEDRCVEFLREQKISVTDALNLYSIALKEKNQTCIHLFSQDIANRLEDFSKDCKFLDNISFHGLSEVVDKYVSSSTFESDDVLLAALCEWALRDPQTRSICFDHFYKKKIRSGRISREVFWYIYSKVLNVKSRSIKKTLESEVCGNEDDLTGTPRTESSSSTTTLATKKLYLFITYTEKTPVKIFSIDENEKCVSSSEFHLKNDSLWIQTTVVENHLYSLEYAHRNFSEGYYWQSFRFYSSIEMRDSFKSINAPPIIFGDVHLCKGRYNNIYAYNRTLFQPTVRSNSRQYSALFDDEKISRGIYLYNTSLDVWLPVPAMKRRVEDACLTTYNDSLYLIGGSSNSGDSPASANKVVQTYDCREGMWHVLLQNTHNGHVNANCCEYDGKIYVCGGIYEPTVVERYDPICGKWEIMENEMPHQVQCHRLVSYNHKLWSLGNSIVDSAPAVFNPVIQSYPHELTLAVPTPKDRWEREFKKLEYSKGGVLLDGFVY